MASGEFIHHNWGAPVHFEDDEQDYSAEEFHEENSIRNYYNQVRGDYSPEVADVGQTLADRQATRAILKKALDTLVDETVKTPWEQQRGAASEDLEITSEESSDA